MSRLHPLANAVEHPAPARHGAPRWQLAAALLLAPLAFSLQVIASYTVASQLCSLHQAPGPALWALNLAALAAAVAGMLLSWRLWERLRDERRDEGHEASQGEGRTRFLALCALCSSTVFVLAVGFDAMVVLVLQACPGLAPVG